MLFINVVSSGSSSNSGTACDRHRLVFDVQITLYAKIKKKYIYMFFLKL